MIFPRYHQWRLVNRLVEASGTEGPGQTYLVQHSAGSGKSNSIAWTAHRLSQLHDADDRKVFDSVIVVTDRTVLDEQLQETIYQFEHADGVVGKINRKEGAGSKSEKLAAALTGSQPIVIVTIQTFPHVLAAIADDVALKDRRYAVIADEAHSSQSGKTAGDLRSVLAKAGTDEADDADDAADAPTAEDMLAAAVAARKRTGNLSYYAFTATPKTKTLELFGRPDDPARPVDKTNLPKAFDVYSMRQAIEERYILDVLENYTSYKVAWQLAQETATGDREVDGKRAKVRLDRWVRLHDYNIASKVKVIVEHYRDVVRELIGGQAKAMVVTGSRKEAVRYKRQFDAYVKKQGYTKLNAMVGFSGEVSFDKNDPNAEGLVGQTFTEAGMNPGLKGRDMRKAFDTPDYHVMIVANKFQTGFDQPKLCAMYVDKKLAGVDCVQTLSRLNRTFPGKESTYVLDFFNDPAEVLAAFQEYYQTAQLLDVSDPNLIWDLFEKLRANDVLRWDEVTRFAQVFYISSRSQAALSNVAKPAAERWKTQYNAARAEEKKQKDLFERAKKLGDATFMANTENDLKEAAKQRDALVMLKADLVSFVRYYDFMSQIVDYDSTDLEKLSLFARHLAPLLREQAPDDEPIDLSSVELSHYRLSKIRQQNLMMVKEGAEGLEPGDAMGTGKAKSKEEIWLSQLIARLNELFVTDNLTDGDLINYAYTLRDKVGENESVMQQIRNNAPEQALLGDFAGAMDDAVMASGEAHKEQMMQYLNNKQLAAGVQRVVFDLLLAQGA